jgi:autotransporter-associated beta strand protein
VSGAWDSTALNWAEGDQRFFTGDSVVFNDTATNKVVTIANPVSPAAVEFNNSAGNDYTFTGTIVTPAGGNVVKQGTGNVTLNGAPSNLGGNLVINGGRVTLATTDYAISLGATAGAIINDTGILRLNGINVLYNATNSTLVTVNHGGTVELNAYHTHFKDLILNGGTLIGMRSDIDTRYNNEYSTFDVSVTVGGTQMSTITRIAGGTGTYSLAGAPFDVADAATGTDLLVNAPFVGGMLTKNGVGTMAMAVSSSYGGGTVINAGSLLANNPTGSGTGNGPVTVKTGALLGGTGTVGGSVTVESGGTLAPGEPIESLATGALTLAAGSTLAIDYNSNGTPTSDMVTVGGNVTLAGTLSLTDLATTQQIVAGGTKLTLLSYTGALTGTFAGLAEDATLTVGVNTFKIRYEDGKKVTLESLASVDDYASWAAAYAPLGLPTADDDSDGMTNREEYAFGLHPKSSTSVNVITTPLSKTTGMFSYVRRKPSLTGLTFKVWTSPNLTAWTEDTAAVQTPVDAGDNQTVSVTLSGTKPLTAPKLFVRITAQ